MRCESGAPARDALYAPPPPLPQTRWSKHQAAAAALWPPYKQATVPAGAPQLQLQQLPPLLPAAVSTGDVASVAFNASELGSLSPATPGGAAAAGAAAAAPPSPDALSPQASSATDTTGCPSSGGEVGPRHTRWGSGAMGYGFDVAAAAAAEEAPRRRLPDAAVPARGGLEESSELLRADLAWSG